MQDVPQTPPAETIDLASMPVEDYDGPHLQGQPTYGCSIASPATSTITGLSACLCPPVCEMATRLAVSWQHRNQGQ